MLENQKKWCLEKVGKGKKWIDEHKFAIGYATGAVAAVGLAYLMDKIYEPKKWSLDTADFTEKDGRSGVGLRSGGIDRFGNETHLGPWVVFYDEESKDRIIEHINEAFYKNRSVTAIRKINF